MPPAPPRHRQQLRGSLCGLLAACVAGAIAPPAAAQTAAEGPAAEQIRWFVETGFAGGGDVLGSVAHLRVQLDENQMQIRTPIAREELTAADSLRLGGGLLVPLSAAWQLQFALGVAWGAIGVDSSLRSAQSLRRIYLRAEAVRRIGRWSLGGGIAQHVSLRYRTDLVSDVSLHADPGPRFSVDFALTDWLRVGGFVEDLNYRSGGVDFDASSIGMQLSLDFQAHP